MFSDSTEIIEAGICGVKNVLLLSHPRPLWHIRFSLPLLSKRIKTLSSNCVSCTPILHSNLYMWLLLSLFTCETDIKHTGWPAWGRRGRERKIEEKKRMQQSSLYTTSATGLLVIYRSLLFLYKNFFSSFFFWVVVNVGFTLSLVLLETQQPPVLTYCLPLYSMTVATTLFFSRPCYILPRLGHSLFLYSSSFFLRISIINKVVANICSPSSPLPPRPLWSNTSDRKDKSWCSVNNNRVLQKDGWFVYEKRGKHER